MPLLKFVSCHDPKLDLRSRELSASEIALPETQNLIDAMLTIARGEQGDLRKHVLVGLAAPQVGHPVRIILVDVQADGKGGTAELRVYLNPIVVESSTETTDWYEGCYSTGNVKGIVSRASRITVEALDRQGRPIREQHTGYVARIFQHEIDHLDGIRFPSRMTAEQPLHLVKSEEMPQYRNQGNWRNWPHTISKDDWKKHQ